MKIGHKVGTIVLVYLGKRGGGQQLFIETFEELVSRNFDVMSIVSKETLDLFPNVGSFGKYVFEIPHDLRNLFRNLKLINIFRLLIELKKEFSKKKYIIVQIMPSPFDLVIDLIAKSQQVPIVRCIHDFQTHPGESWPNNRAIVSRVNRATHIVTFSNFVANQIKFKFNRQSYVCTLPQKIYFSKEKSFLNSINGKILKNKERKAIRVGFVGRALEYKGLEVLAEAFAFTKSDFDFVAAGFGKFPLSILTKYPVTNRWLEDSELDNFLDNLDIAIFPYIEASQSGLIPICIAKGKLVVASNLDGLREQLLGYPFAFLSKPKDALDLALKIDLAVAACETKSKRSSSSFEETDSLFNFLIQLNHSDK